MSDVEFTRRRVEVLVQAIISECRYPLALRWVEEGGAGSWRITVEAAGGAESTFAVAGVSSPDLYFAVKEHLAAVLGGWSTSE